MSRLHTPKAGFWIRLCVVLIVPFTRLTYRIRWSGLERIPEPARGGVIIALNHVSHIDTLLTARAIWTSGRIPRFLVKSTLFHQPVVGRIMRGARQIPVYRGTTDAARSLRDAVAALARGEAIVIYPEGTITRQPEQWPMQGRTGIARLWLLAPETPVVPAGQWGAQQRRFRPGRLLRRPVSQLRVGPPVDLTRFRGAEPTAATLRAITDTIMTAVRDQVAGLREGTPPPEFFRPDHRHVDAVSVPRG
jgi:1-acyl-sn-glycerol-3-phosphate acyltransferase